MTTKIIDTKDIPPITRQQKWVKIFTKLPKGKAIELKTRKEFQTAYLTLRYHKKKGNFTNIIATQRQNRFFIINPKEEKTK